MRQGFRDRPALDTAVSRAVLQRVSEGSAPETLRLFRPKAEVAFGPKDRISPGYEDAVAAARGRGFRAVERLAGGRAAVFHEETIAFAWTIHAASPRDGIVARFDDLAGMIAAALRDLGVDARVGQVPGEYCPGAHSLNARGRTKLMGVGQRLVPHAAHVGGVVVVGGAGRVRDVLVPVYEALDVPWDPATSGSVADEVADVRWGDVERAIIKQFSSRYDVVEDVLSPETVALARRLAPQHVPAFGARDRTGGA